MSSLLNIADLRHRLLLLAGLAFFIQALIPLGFMPNLSGTAGQAITICSGSGLKTIYLPAEQAPDQDHEKTAERCAFSVVMTAAGIPQPVMTALPVSPIMRLSVFLPNTIFIPDHSVRTYPPTGPPTTA